MPRFYVAGLVVLALLAAIVLPGSVASAPGGGGIANTEPGADTVSVCRFKAQKIDGITDDSTGKTTTSPEYVDIPNTTIAVDIGGSATTCAKVEFSAYCFRRDRRNGSLVRPGHEGRCGVRARRSPVLG